MNRYLSLPLALLKFWFYQAPMEIFEFFSSLNKAFFQLFALPLFLKTFFNPLKNEYRKGLVGFSRAMGIMIKSVLIIVDLVMFIPLLCIEVLVFVAFIAFPILTIGLLFM